jgi:ABC-type proline/glycine betaine transport system substrate-binding protein
MHHLGRITALAVASALLFASAADAAKCKDPKTGKFIKCPPAAAATASPSAKPASAAAKPVSATAPAMASASAPAKSGAPHCTTGKPCGKACIAKDKVCHMPD